MGLGYRCAAAGSRANTALDRSCCQSSALLQCMDPAALRHQVNEFTTITPLVTAASLCVV